MNDKVKDLLNFIFRFGLSGALLVWLFRQIDIEKTQETIKSADVTFLIYGAIIFWVINAILLFRWQVFVKALDLTARGRDLIKYYFIGLFGNLFLPSAIGGDIIKIIGLAKGHNQKSKVVASVLLDRLSGFAGIVIVAVLSFIIGYKYLQGTDLLIPIVIMGAASATVVTILFNEKIYSFCCSVFRFIPKFQKALMNMHYDVVLLKDRKLEGYKAILISCLSQTVFAFCWYVIAKALHQDISFIYFLIFVPLICIASSVPSIGGLGVREAGAAFLLAKVGVDSGVAVSISLISYLYMVMVGLVGGIIYVATLSSRRVQHSASDVESARDGV